jgi:hypothetical protein
VALDRSGDGDRHLGGDQLGQFSQVLSGGGDQELVVCPLGLRSLSRSRRRMRLRKRNERALDLRIQHRRKGARGKAPVTLSSIR